MKTCYLITGTSSGIGENIAKYFIRKKIYIVGISRRKNQIQNKNFYHLRGDLVDKSFLNEIKDFLINKKLKLDGLVNNAGINLPNKFNKISEKDYDKVMNNNLKAPFFLIQKLLPYFKNKSSIVNISSFSAISGGPYSSHYAISKSGIETLTKNLSIFFKDKKIRVNAISPGLIRTRLAKNFKKHPYFNRILLNRIGETEEITNVVEFLLSSKSSYINGQTINVDGGMFLR